ncbi:sulfatase [Belnapia sp. T6]|uniref:Sulfatase n=1 Tax=Belnapia mucosa TaxID=2804532 RepID=A0ABS1V3T0_9PROT|nr:sulfatase [Belnapia mucosa]MBL6456341.1 sulfatase [Belnapia mucosa]
MRLIFVLFDSLNRHALGAYGGRLLPTPNFDRLAACSATFDRHYVGSLPCMPARRDLMTGRLNFLHRAWGPLEPFDNAFPEVLRAASGTYSHLVTDHYHYFEDGGVGFHGRYSSWEFFRGQEKDKWKGLVAPPMERWRGTYHPTQFDGRTDPNANLPYYVSREQMREEAQFPLALCTAAALEFLETNRGADNWLLQLECFDPHEPFFAAARFRDGLPTNYRGPVLDWPRYGQPGYAPEEEAELRANYLALLAMCDEYLGRLLDWMDATGAWGDTALIVSTDHGLLLGEHEYWGKNRPPFFEEVAHIPLFLHHPDFASAAGTRRGALTQTTDLMPTILDIFGAPVPPEVRGRSLLPVLARDEPVREGVIYGQFGGAVNCCDGRFAYLRYPEAEGAEVQLHHYTLMPVHMRTFFEPQELARAELAGPFGFTKGMPVLKLPLVPDAAANMIHRYPLLDARTALYDLDSDPGQATPLDAPAEAVRLAGLMRRLMAEQEAPPEAYARLGLEGVGQ